MDETRKDKLGIEAWDLHRSGNLKSAIEIYDNLIENGEDSLDIFNRGTAYLQMGSFKLALEDFETALEIRGMGLQTSGDLIYAGICNWGLNLPTDAISLWRRALKSPYTDAGGGVVPAAFLLYAGARLENVGLSKEAISEVKKLSPWNINEWPAQVPPFLLGKIETANLRSALTRVRSDILLNRWQCQLDFYIGLKKLVDGDMESFRNYFQNCTSSEFGFLEPHFFIAEWEVQNGFPTPLSAR